MMLELQSDTVFSYSMPQYPPATTNDLASFNCPLCGSTQAFVVSVPRPKGETYYTPFFECAGCTVMFRDVRRFMWLIKHHKDLADPRGLHHVSTPQRVLDGLNHGGNLADKLAKPDRQ